MTANPAVVQQQPQPIQQQPGGMLMPTPAPPPGGVSLLTPTPAPGAPPGATTASSTEKLAHAEMALEALANVIKHNNGKDMDCLEVLNTSNQFITFFRRGDSVHRSLQAVVLLAALGELQACPRDGAARHLPRDRVRGVRGRHRSLDRSRTPAAGELFHD